VKLFIQIPCFNEESTLPDVVRSLPDHIDGIDTIEILVVDDGSSDRTIAVAHELGVHHVLELGSNRGLAAAFALGVDFALSHGADILVNTDGDNQYCGEDIHKLVEPILRNRADLVVGCRPIRNHPEFSPFKKVLQIFGSYVLRLVSKTRVRDATSGFRAFNREAMSRLFIHSRFSYCMETLIQAGNSLIRVDSVDIRVNRQTRPSRLFRNIPQYVFKQTLTILWMFVLYRPVRFFAVCAMFLLLAAAGQGARLAYLLYLHPHPVEGQTYLALTIQVWALAFMGFLLLFLGVLAELSRAHRRLQEDLIARQRR
jgi:glycosyltransferase involved in cell wall biosynthesis